MSDCPTCAGSGKTWNGLLQEHRPCIDCADTEVARIMALSDAEITAEARRDGLDLAAVAAEGQALFERALKTSKPT